jgi:hypothetical protein
MGVVVEDDDPLTAKRLRGFPPVGREAGTR